MKKLAIAAAALMLSGCASIPQPKPQTSQRSVSVAKPAPKPVEATTPNQIVKKRWYDRFIRHKPK